MLLRVCLVLRFLVVISHAALQGEREPAPAIPKPLHRSLSLPLLGDTATSIKGDNQYRKGDRIPPLDRYLWQMQVGHEARDKNIVERYHIHAIPPAESGCLSVDKSFTDPFEYLPSMSSCNANYYAVPTWHRIHDKRPFPPTYNQFMDPSRGYIVCQNNFAWTDEAVAQGQELAKLSDILHMGYQLACHRRGHCSPIRSVIQSHIADDLLEAEYAEVYRQTRPDLAVGAQAAWRVGDPGADRILDTMPAKTILHLLRQHQSTLGRRYIVAVILVRRAKHKIKTKTKTKSTTGSNSSGSSGSSTTSKEPSMWDEWSMRLELGDSPYADPPRLPRHMYAPSNARTARYIRPYAAPRPPGDQRETRRGHLS